MNFFALELKRICSRSEYIRNPKFISNNCVFRLTNDITGKLEFVTRGVHGRYEAIKISLFNRTRGLIDNELIDLTDVFGKQNVNGYTSSPHIWDDSGNLKWYAVEPRDGDYAKLAQIADDYLSCFSDQELSEDETLDISLF